MEVRKTVTVLFADVTGSTALGERLDPEAIRGVMSRYFDETRAAVEPSPTGASVTRLRIGRSARVGSGR